VGPPDECRSGAGTNGPLAFRRNGRTLAAHGSEHGGPLAGPAPDIPAEGYFDFPDLVAALLEQGARVGTFPFDGFWLDIGRRDDYELALERFRASPDSARERRSAGL
jgi:NDP-sugar pyrophosphorylase family protein